MGALPKMAIHSEGVVVQVTAGPLSACATSVRCYQSHMFRMEGHRRHFQQPKGQSQTKRLALRHRRAGEEDPTSAIQTVLLHICYPATGFSREFDPPVDVLGCRRDIRKRRELIVVVVVGIEVKVTDV
ncbi:hypothetical protein NEUTE1DRAFT_85793 [Neurospora tetrasperma FGSC 2508]|uniref:Uncharacterized protein n=1 Tax=Neurospora tetrasperma (strain FGSC 2508 / ATCC MYA-4615 / P0657) TaxID=510951 RepID=F8MTY4_NEUT8|nr:uncharacterized protein NEUTE1DRAFT_85793 [Neurospora tetrasperma FGSC 2508]EGO55466.1 hypothetical protein NEUTE1DRAFT_85793 [Neurospora tetrasperma FGSC 2508]EGZ69305.1 hypothetical protein NEUTE2DRAFT_115690 [Neurospora tetrasperma FGSC 2509]